MCPACQEPLRDIEFAHLDSQKSLAESSGTQFTHKIVLFCGHRVEVTVDGEALNIQLAS